jgi:hypothetical protein
MAQIDMVGVGCAVLKAFVGSREEPGLSRCDRGRGVDVSKKILRMVLTVLMYAGVGVFLYPYFTGKIMAGILFMILGGLCTVVCGFLRCYLTEGDCSPIPHPGRDW